LLLLLAEIPVFAKVLRPLPNNHGETGLSWWITALLATTIPTATFFWLQNLGLVTPNAFWPQQITNGIVVWALGNGLLTAVLLTLSYYFMVKRRAHTADHFGFNQSLVQIGWTFLMAVSLIALLYAIVKIVDGLFTLDFRFWVVALKSMSSFQFKIFLFYAPAFVLFFLTVSALLNGPLRRNQGNGLDCRVRQALFTNSIILSLGLCALLVIQYGHLFSTGILLIAEPLLTIVAIQFIPLLIFVACVSTFCFRLTGRSYLGAFVNGLFVSWYVVAGQATHFAG